MFNFPELSLFLSANELFLSLCRKIVSKAHSQSISNDHWEANRQNISGGSSWSDPSSDNGQGVDDPIESTIDGGL